jgi:hypothetical protein
MNMAKIHPSPFLFYLLNVFSIKVYFVVALAAIRKNIFIIIAIKIRFGL